jgi:hypothetical protein
MFKHMKKMGLFPFVPLVPLAMAGGLIALEVFTLRRLRSLNTKVDSLLGSQPLEGAQPA